MLELIGFTTAVLVVGALIVAALVSIALPLGWLWMLIDAILREDTEYPGASANARLMWVLLIALLPITAIAYFFIVYAKVKRGAPSTVEVPGLPAPQSAPSVPQAPASAVS